MTLWLPALDYARSYTPVVRGILQRIDAPGCVEVVGLTRPQLAALRFHGGLDLRSGTLPSPCPWLLASQDIQASLGMVLQPRQWSLVATIRRPTDAKDNLLLYRKR